MRGFGGRLAVGAALILVAAPSAAEVEPAASSAFAGPLRARDLTAFGYLRLDMRPASTARYAPGSWYVDSQLAYQNTWALTPRVQKYLRSQRGRRPLAPEDVAAIHALPGENYLVDLDLAEFSMTLRRQWSGQWASYVIVSGVSYGGGILDGTVEQFHTAFGLSDYGRPAVPRGQINVIYDLKSQQVASLDKNPRSGLLDPTVGLVYTGVELPAPWQVALEAAVKIPAGGERTWLSTGHADVGAQVTLAYAGARHAVFGNAAVVHYAGSGEDSSRREEKLLPAVVLGFESKLAARTHSVVQLYASPSVYDRSETSLDELRANKYLLSVGLRQQAGPHLFTIAMTENLGNHNNTPDIAMQFGWAYRPSP